MTETLSTSSDRPVAGADSDEVDDRDVGAHEAEAHEAEAHEAGGNNGRADLAQEDRRYRLALDRAMGLLARREHSVRELARKLIGKGVDAATAGLVVDDLRGRGLQSDRRCAESVVHSRVGRGQGPLRIRQELSRRGIAADIVDAALSADDDQWLARAEEARRRKFGDALPQDREAWRRQGRFLAQRGFPSDLIYRMLGHTGD